MPSPPRQDPPGSIQHIFDRGIAHRTVCENSADIRHLLACMARAVRRGEIEILAFAILTTHFHFLIRSPCGQMGQAMMRALNAYVRRFNRLRDRDGSLFRGRYESRLVTSAVYLNTLRRYIDMNPVDAKLADDPRAYRWCSAWYLARARCPRWLNTSWLEPAIIEQGYRGDAPMGRATLEPPLTEAERALVRSRMRCRIYTDDPLDDLLAAASPGVLAWLRRQTELADGTRPGLAFADPGSLRRVVKLARASDPELTWKSNGRGLRDAWSLAEAYLLRELCGLVSGDIAGRLHMSPSSVRRAIVRARTLLLDEAAEFGTRLAELAHRALRLAHRERRGLRSHPAFASRHLPD